MSFHPQTPQSPSQLSPGTSDHMTSLASSMTSISTALPTPAHSVNGSSIPSEMAHDITMGGGSPQKRKRATEDLGGRDQEMAVAEDRIGMEKLHEDVGEKYLLCRTPHRQPRPPISEDLFEMYGLTGLAAEVARVLPNGEKNAIRKTYKGHIKKLGVQGAFDSVKEDWQRQDSLLNLAKCGIAEWNVHFVRGQDLNDGLSPEVQAKLQKAATMSKGMVPKSLWDSSVLGEMGPGGRGDKQTGSARPTAPNTPMPYATNVQRPKPTAAQEAARPKRSIKKRSYGDSSFEGYGEGYPDDGMETGYSTAEGDMAPGKRRKKSHPVGQQSYAQARQPGYGLGVPGA